MKILSKISALAFLAILLYFGCKKDQNKTTVGALPVQAVSAAKIPNGMLLTPQGLMPKANVHLIENGYHLELRGGHVLKINTITGALKEDFGAIKLSSPTQTQAPAENASKTVTNVSTENGINRAITSSPSGGEWMTYAEYPAASGASSPIGLFQSTWTVPSNPSTIGAQIYIGNGVEDGQNSNNSPASGYLVIEPALLWGYNGAPGTPTNGSGWTISNWCSWSGGAAYTTPIAVTTGTSLTGIVTLTNYVSPNYEYTSAFNGQSNPLTVLYNSTQGANSATIPAVPIENYAFESLQAYGLTSVNEYPGQTSVNMTNILVETGTAGGAGNFTTPPSLQWNYFSTSQAAFGEHTIIGPNTTQTNPTPNTTGEVQLWFRNAAPSISYPAGPLPPVGGYPNYPYYSCAALEICPNNTGGPETTYTMTSTGTGLSINPTTGCITGTPAETQTCTVTATNDGIPSTSVTEVTITVEPSPTISYPAVFTAGTGQYNTNIYNQGSTITPVYPTVTGPTPTSYSISPSLSGNTGLSFSSSTGEVYGKATTPSPATTYTVTATSGSCATTTTFTIGVALPFTILNNSSYVMTCVFQTYVNNQDIAYGRTTSYNSFNPGSNTTIWLPPGSYAPVIYQTNPPTLPPPTITITFSTSGTFYTGSYGELGQISVTVGQSVNNSVTIVNN